MARSLAGILRELRPEWSHEYRTTYAAAYFVAVARGFQDCHEKGAVAAFDIPHDKHPLTSAERAGIDALYRATKE